MAFWGLILGFCLANIAQILAVEPSPDTYDQIYNKAREAYGSAKWLECVTQVKNALNDYKFYRSTLITCRHECREKVIKDNETSISPELENMIPFFFKIIKVSNCVRECKQKHMPGRPDVSVHLDIEEDFEMRMPYDYLQYCYYKRDNIKEAIAAAYTYLMADSKQDTTVQNLMYYQSFAGVEVSDFIDLERRPYQTAFIKGQENQRDEKWQDVIKHIGKAVNEFIKEVEDCRILCEGPFDHESFPEFINAVSEHFISVLKCQNKCEEKLSLLHGEKVKDFFPELYNYLQFAYYKLDDIPNAVKATASYLLFKPNDEAMLENKRIYINTGITPENIMPRPEAMKYFTHSKQIKNILQYVSENYVFTIDDEGEIDDVSDASHLSSPEEILESKPPASILISSQ